MPLLHLMNVLCCALFQQTSATVHIHPWAFAENTAGVLDGVEHEPAVDAEAFAHYWAEAS